MADGSGPRFRFSIPELKSFAQSTSLGDDIYIVIPRRCHISDSNTIYDINEPDLYSLPGYNYIYVASGSMNSSDPASGPEISHAFGFGDILWDPAIYASGKQVIPGGGSKWYSGVGINLKSLVNFLNDTSIMHSAESCVIIYDDIYVTSNDGSYEDTPNCRIELDFVLYNF